MLTIPLNNDCFLGKVNIFYSNKNLRSFHGRRLYSSAGSCDGISTIYYNDIEKHARSFTITLNFNKTTHRITIDKDLNAHAYKIIWDNNPDKINIYIN